MGRQEATFLNYEGDGWFDRNYVKIEMAKDADPVTSLIAILNIKPERVVEIGCSNGWRLELLRRRYSCECVGLDPSLEAIKTGRLRYPDIEFWHAGASDSETRITASDLLIFGFCLYLCDREDLGLIVGDHDTCLIDGGHLIIHDFDPEYPHKVPYKHVDGLFSYKMDYSKLWLANPAYSLVSKTIIGDGTAVWVLKKDIDAGWPLGEAT